MQVTQSDVRTFIQSHHPIQEDPKGLSTTGLNIKGKLEVMKTMNQEDRNLIEEFTLIKTPGKLRKLAKVSKLHIGQSQNGNRTPEFMLRAEKINNSISPSGDESHSRVANVPKLPVLMTRSISFSNKGLRPITSPYPLNHSPYKKDGLADLEHLKEPPRLAENQASSALVLIKDEERQEDSKSS